MPSKFEFGTTDKLFERIAKDEELSKIVEEIIFKCKMASDRGVPMDELASACTMGWFMGQDPEIAKIYKFIVSSHKLNRH